MGVGDGVDVMKRSKLGPGNHVSYRYWEVKRTMGAVQWEEICEEVVARKTGVTDTKASEVERMPMEKLFF